MQEVRDALGRLSIHLDPSVKNVLVAIADQLERLSPPEAPKQAPTPVAVDTAVAPATGEEEKSE